MSRVLLVSALALILGLAGCGGYRANVDAKARMWAQDCGCDKITDFKNVSYVEGTATRNNGEQFSTPAKAALADYTFNCYYNGVGWKTWTFSAFLLNNPVTDHDFGFMGDEAKARASATRSGFTPT